MLRGAFMKRLLFFTILTCNMTYGSLPKNPSLPAMYNEKIAREESRDHAHAYLIVVIKKLEEAQNAIPKKRAAILALQKEYKATQELIQGHQITIDTLNSKITEKHFNIREKILKVELPCFEKKNKIAGSKRSASPSSLDIDP
jgi:peptidoglycan hydrolase CwlO-like protein